jgi:hypothetical protein
MDPDPIQTVDRSGEAKIARNKKKNFMFPRAEMFSLENYIL